MKFRPVSHRLINYEEQGVLKAVVMVIKKKITALY